MSSPAVIGGAKWRCSGKSGAKSGNWGVATRGKLTGTTICLDNESTDGDEAGDSDRETWSSDSSRSHGDGLGAAFRFVPTAIGDVNVEGKNKNFPKGARLTVSGNVFLNEDEDDGEDPLGELDSRWAKTLPDASAAYVAAAGRSSIPCRPTAGHNGIRALPYKTLYSRPRRYKEGNGYSHHYMLPTVSRLLSVPHPEFLKKRAFQVVRRSNTTGDSTSWKDDEDAWDARGEQQQAATDDHHQSATHIVVCAPPPQYPPSFLPQFPFHAPMHPHAPVPPPGSAFFPPYAGAASSYAFHDAPMAAHPSGGYPFALASNQVAYDRRMGPWHDNAPPPFPHPPGYDIGQSEGEMVFDRNLGRYLWMPTARNSAMFSNREGMYDRMAGRGPPPYGDPSPPCGFPQPPPWNAAQFPVAPQRRDGWRGASDESREMFAASRQSSFPGSATTTPSRLSAAAGSGASRSSLPEQKKRTFSSLEEAIKDAVERKLAGALGDVEFEVDLDEDKLDINVSDGGEER